MPWTARTAIIVSFVLLGCEQPAPPPAEATLVRALGVQMTQFDRTAALTGEIQARHESNLGFRVGGKVIERLVDVGSYGCRGRPARPPGQPGPAERPESRPVRCCGGTGIHRAEPDAGGAPAQTSRRWLYDQDPVRQRPAAVRSGTGRTGLAPRQSCARPRTRCPIPNCGPTAPGSSRPRERSRVRWWHPARWWCGWPIRTSGRRCSRFREPASGSKAGSAELPPVEVRLVSDQNLVTEGTIREVSPGVDPVTRTYTVKVALIDPPPAFLLGSSVVGRAKLPTQSVINLPSSALFQTAQGEPAVWVVDQPQDTVSLRPVSVLQYDTGTVTVSSGLECRRNGRDRRQPEAQAGTEGHDQAGERSMMRGQVPKPGARLLPAAFLIMAMAMALAGCEEQSAHEADAAR